MRILFIGDIFGRPGRAIVKDRLPGIVRDRSIDLIIANGENAAAGFGITGALAEELANFPPGMPGWGLYQGQKGQVPYAVINLQGRVFMASNDDPFRTADQLLEKLDAKVILVDMHAEATSEKMSLGWYLDGRVTAVIGTHTHVPTADERVLPQGTAYITDVGMTGPYDGVIGVKKELVVNKFLNGMPVRFEPATGDPRLCAVVIDCDEKTGKARQIERLMLS